MADLTPVYDALRKAGAAGDSASVAALASYLKAQERPVRSMDVLADGRQVPTGSPEAQAGYAPTRGFLGNALDASGKFFTDMALGARQIYGEAQDRLTGSNLTAGLNQEVADKRALDAPLMATGGGKAGYIGTGILSGAVAPGSSSYLGAALAGGGFGALAPTIDGESRFNNAAMGAGLGMAGKFVGDTFGNWLRAKATEPGGLTGAQQQAAAAGESIGMKMTPGQRSGSVPLQQFEAKMESQPWSSGPLNAIKGNNQAVLNQQWAAKIGEDGASALDSSVLGRANDRLGQVFESVRNADRVAKVDPAQVKATIDAIDSSAEGLLPASIRSNPLVARFESLAQSGEINGEQLGSLSSKLGRAAYKQMSGPNGDRDLGQALYAVKDHIDDIVGTTLDATEQAAYNAARGQYRNLMTLTSRPGIVNEASGNVNPVSLANKLRTSDRAGYLFGKDQSDAYNAVRFSKAFQPIVGNSGTATRSPNLADAVVGIPLNLATRAYLSDPVQKLITSGVAAGRGASAINQSIFAPAERLAAPYVNAGLYGLGVTSVPYLTQ